MIIWNLESIDRIVDSMWYERVVIVPVKLLFPVGKK